MIIKHLYKHTIGLGFLCIWMLMGLCACSTDTSDIIQQEVPPPLGYTYSMRLNGSLTDFNQSARASHSWSDGSKLYVQFMENGTRITGTATFSLEENAWKVTTTKALKAPDDAYCEVYYFVNPSSALTSTVTMDMQTVVYADKNGGYILEEDDAIAVNATLSPLTGRIRFVGTPKTEYKVSGLTTYTNYSVSNNTFTASSRKLSVSMDENGSSGYYYALFEDERQLVVNGEGKSAYLRTFADHVLTAGSSGFVTLPSAENLGSWALVNTDNFQEINLPVLSAVTVSTIRSKSAGVHAIVTSLSNGSLLECGIVCSTNANPTLENSTCYDGKESEEITLRVKSLEPETYYYVRAYARNERGTSWSEITSFKTISEAEEDSDFDKDEFDDEEHNLNDNVSSENTEFDKGYFEDDKDFNKDFSSEGSDFSKDGFNNDNNWN